MHPPDGAGGLPPWLAGEIEDVKVMSLNSDMTLAECAARPEMTPYQKYIVYNSPYCTENADLPLRCLQPDKPEWTAAVVAGLERLSQISQAGSRLHYLYPDSADEDKRDVNIIHFPARRQARKPWILLCPGGAYQNVWALTEAYPIAAHFNALGHDVFTLTYRVGGSGLLPKPLDDVAAAVRYIQAHAAAFQVEPDSYVVGGFSAGGNLAALWGTTAHGAAAYGLPRPRALLLVYPVVYLRQFSLVSACGQEMAERLFGSAYSQETLSAYDVDLLVDAAYPPTFLVACKDDEVVPFEHSVTLKTRLEHFAIPSQLELDDCGGHGFADGSGTDAAYWYQRAEAFLNSID